MSSARRSTLFILFAFFVVSLLICGCEVIPNRTYVPTLHNPFPQLTEVAVIPFINKTSDNPMVDGREFAEAYAEQLQEIPGFNVVAVSTVERAMLDLNLLAFRGPEDLRRLANYLQVDAIVIGTVNRYDGFYPPEIGMEVEWYAANPYMHPIPPGYGLPWGTPAEEQIPSSIVFESELALAREQMETQMPESPNPSGLEPSVPASEASATSSSSEHSSLWEQSGESYQKSDYEKQQSELFDRTIAKAQGIPLPPVSRSKEEDLAEAYRRSPLTPSNPEYTRKTRSQTNESGSGAAEAQGGEGAHSEGAAEEEAVSRGGSSSSAPEMMPWLEPGAYAEEDAMMLGHDASLPGLPDQWPDPRGLIPDGPKAKKPNAMPSNAAILRHVGVYQGNDAKVTEALKTYYLTEVDDARIGGWQNVLHRREEFISFCCRMHIWEMLSSRGGAGEAIKYTRQSKLWRGGQPGD